MEKRSEEKDKSGVKLKFSGWGDENEYRIQKKDNGYEGSWKSSSRYHERGLGRKRRLVVYHQPPQMPQCRKGVWDEKRAGMMFCQTLVPEE